MDGPAEEKESLWLLTASPAIWAAHFLLCYGTVAVWCAKWAGTSGNLLGARVAVVVYTVISLAGVAVTGVRGYRQHRYGTATVPHDFDTAADRHRFLGFATLLLSGLSAVAIVYVAMAAAFIGDCR